LREYGFALTEHDPDRPCLVLGREHRTIMLPYGLCFSRWRTSSGQRHGG
jgi:hypothetical protein